MIMKLALPFLAVLVLVALSPLWARADHERGETVNEMLLRRIDWITEHYPDLTYNGEPLPEVVMAPHENLQNMAGLEATREVRAVYDSAVNVLYLREDFEVDGLDSAFVIVHELVHFLQNVRDPPEPGECLGGREPEAYEVMEQWQEEFGPWPRDWNWLYVMAISQCREEGFWAP